MNFRSKERYFLHSHNGYTVWVYQLTPKPVNVWIHGFDDAKVESNNKVVSTNIQRLNIALRLIQGYFNKHSKVKHCFKINSRSSKQDQEKDKASNNLIVDWFLPQNKLLPRDQRHW